MPSGACKIYEEIEVTPEMVETGRHVLWSYNRENDFAEEVVSLIYRKMESVRRGRSREDNGCD
jgi:hypothetical protein